MSDENVIFMDFFAVKLKLTEMMSYRESLYMETALQISAMATLPSTLIVKKVHEDDIFVKQHILQFFSGESKDNKNLKSP